MKIGNKLFTLTSILILNFVLFMNTGVKSEFIKVKDSEGNIVYSRPLTTSEVYKYKDSNIAYAAINGQTQYKDKLSLYTSVSGTSPNYWVQGNACWSSGDTSSGDEFMGILWESSFHGNNNSSSTLVYSNFNNLTYNNASLNTFDAYHGATWSFSNKAPIRNFYLTGAYIGISVTRHGSYGYHYFSTEYIHTYTSSSFQVQVSLDSTKTVGATLTVTPTQNCWKLASYVSGNF